MKKITILFLLCWTVCIASAQMNVNNTVQRIRVADNQHTLIYEDGKPFFWLGDTGWELFHRLTRAEVEMYLKKRSAQGFNVIQAVALAELDGLRVPNANGDLPLINNDPLKPNDPYFNHVEWVIDKAAENGIYIALLPTWGDKVFKDRWGEGPEIFNQDNARQYGRWIAARFKNKKNIIWVTGGDRTPRNESDVNIWRALGIGIVEGIGNETDALITFHPQPSATSSSSPWFHNESWFDFNMLQTGHCRDVKVWEKITRDYNLKPAKPTLNGEPIYEDHPVCFNAKELGYSNAYDIRKAAYLSVFAGSAGITYGCHAVWQFYNTDRKPINGPLKTWQASLDLPAASQMKFLKLLMSKIDFGNVSPAQEMLIDTLDGTNRIQALQSANDLLIYTAAGDPVRLNSDIITQRSLRSAVWYDPRTGRQRKISVKGNNLLFTPPTKGENNDWVLMVRLR
jgi:hypothetical protein